MKLVPSWVSEYRVWKTADWISRLLCAPNRSILDVGCGQGKITKMCMTIMPNCTFMGTDITNRLEARIPFTLYDGKTLPFNDQSFDHVMLIDVLHHTTDYRPLLREAARVSRKDILIKDHFDENWWDHWRLVFFDWLGNLPFDIPCPYNFKPRKEWIDLLASEGMQIEKLQMYLHTAPSPYYWLCEHNFSFFARIARSQ